MSKSKIRLQQCAELIEKYSVLKDLKPLAIGFYDQLYLAIKDEKLCKFFLGRLPRNSKYLKSFSIYENRYNLDGSIASDLTVEHREFAATKLKSILLIRDEKDAKKKKAKLFLKTSQKLSQVASDKSQYKKIKV